VRLTDRAVLLFYTFALFVVTGFQRFLDRDPTSPLLDANAGEVLALIAIYTVLKPNVAALSRLDLAVIAACAMFLLAPVSQHFVFVGATIAGLYLWLRRPDSPELRNVAQLWLAIAIYESWGRLFFKLVSAPIIQAEVFVIAKTGFLFGFPLSVDGIRLVSPNGWYIFILDACSSFHNASLAVLVWLSLIKISESEIRRPQWIALGAAILAIVGLNVFRILLMTSSPESHYFWHVGDGTIVFSILTLLAVAVPTIRSLRRAG
jgi:exosortase/archaeosortase family protein